MNRRRLIERLRLLCASGAGLEAIAVPACEAIRDLLGVASASLFWFDGAGEPAGYWHDCTDVAIKDLFVTRLEDLFARPDEFNVVSLGRQDGPAIGRMLGPEMEALFRQSNVYRHLAGPLGHEHCLDVRIDDGPRTAAVLALWRLAGHPFTPADARAAQPVRALLEAAAAERAGRVTWRTVSGPGSHLIVDAAGAALIAIDPGCEGLLVNAHLLRQNVPHAGQLRAAPAFCRQLLAMPGDAVLHLAVPGGRLECRASRALRRAGAEGLASDPVVVTVALQQAAEVAAIERLSAQELTMRQKQVAMAALDSASRANVATLLGLGEEAVKKHLAAIYAATGTAGLAELRGWLLAD